MILVTKVFLSRFGEFWKKSLQWWTGTEVQVEIKTLLTSVWQRKEKIVTAFWSVVLFFVLCEEELSFLLDGWTYEDGHR